MAKPAKFIIDIYPITSLSLKGQQFYSYLWNAEIPAGSLVSIPFYKRNIEGIAIDSRTDFHRLGNIELKKVSKVQEENFLDTNQVKLAEFISDYYFSPIGKALKFFTPKRVKARVVKHKTYDIKHTEKKIKLTKEQQSAVDKITKKINWKLEIGNWKFLLHGPASSGKTEVYIHSILKLKEKNKDAQFLILLPELTLTPQAIERYGEYFKPEEIAVLHSKIGKGQFYSNWRKIKSGEAKIIIGTRMAIFAPFRKLGLIVIDEEQDMSFKQWDMSPRYDARAAAEKLAELNKCPIVFGSATPRIESYWKAKNGEYKLLELPRLKLRDAKYETQDAKIELVDMKKERWQKNYSSISKKLKSEIGYALKNKQQIILFVNKQGMSNFSVCDKCKTVLRCPKCERALVYDNSGIYKCAHCAHKSDILAACPKCKGLSFKNIGFGTQKIEREIAGLFPGARLARADSQSMKQAQAQEKLYADFKNKKVDILIGTQMISKGWDLPAVSLIGIIDADNHLAIPDFRTSERAFQNMLQVAGRVGRINSEFPAVILVQTFNPEGKFFKLLAEKNIGEFYEKEIAERKALSLPPFSGIIKLVFQDYAKDKIKKESLRVYELLRENSASVSEPQDSFVSNIRGRYRKQIIIKIKEAIPVKITEILRALPHGWIIDVDPISII